jgi:hypothetical protein
MTVAAHLRMRQVRLRPEPENSLPSQRDFGEFRVRGMLEMHDSSMVLVRDLGRRKVREDAAKFRVFPSCDRPFLKAPETMT